jgi:hypothetical protein
MKFVDRFRFWLTLDNGHFTWLYLCVFVHSTNIVGAPVPFSPAVPRDARTAHSPILGMWAASFTEMFGTVYQARRRNTTFRNVSLSGDGITPVSGAGGVTTREAVKLESTDIERPLVTRYWKRLVHRSLRGHTGTIIPLNFETKASRNKESRGT